MKRFNYCDMCSIPSICSERRRCRYAKTPAKESPSAHDKAWEKGFIVPIAKEMKARGVAYLLITIRDDGKAAYVLEPAGDRVFGDDSNPENR